MEPLERFSSTCLDYVDINGRELNVNVADDGSIYIPLQEIRKSGFHVFPKVHYNRMLVGKSVIMDEFNKYMLGAATDYLIANRINFIDTDEIIESIEMCRRKLCLGNGTTNETTTSTTPTRTTTPAKIITPPKMMNLQSSTTTTSKVLGRTLLQDPREVFKQMKSPPSQSHNGSESHNDNANISNGNTSRNLNFVVKSNWNTNDKPFNRNNSNRDVSRHSNSSNDSMSNSNGESNNSKKNFGPHSKYSRPSDQKQNDEVYYQDMPLKSLELSGLNKMVKVTHIQRNGDKEKYWVTLLENENLVEDVTIKCNQLCETGPTVVPQNGDIVMAKSEIDNAWYRAFIRRSQPSIRVLFVDYGNEENIMEVKELPKELSNIPAQSVRVTLSKSENAKVGDTLKIDEVTCLKFVKKFADTTWLVEKVEDNKSIKKTLATTETAQNYQSVFLTNLIYTTTVSDNDIVRIVSYSDGIFYLRNKAIFDQLKSIIDQIQNSPRIQLNKVEIGQVVSCKQKNEEYLCRAIVKNIDGTLIEVTFIDFLKTETMILNQLYGISKEIANLPVALIKTPLIKGYKNEKLTENGESLLEEIITTKHKLNISFKQNVFDLVYKDKMMSELLFSRTKNDDIDLRLKPAVSEEKIKADNREPQATALLSLGPVVTIKNETVQAETTKIENEEKYVKCEYLQIKLFDVPIGLCEYLLSIYIQPTEFYMNPTSDAKGLEYLDQCLLTDADVDDEPFKPESGDMCLAKYLDNWCRGTPVDVDGNEFSIFFVDYGNTDTVHFTNIRKFPKKLADIPILGLPMKMEVPDTDAVKNRLKELFLEGTIYKVNIISFIKKEYIFMVDIPEIRDVLDREELI